MKKGEQRRNLRICLFGLAAVMGLMFMFVACSGDKKSAEGQFTATVSDMYIKQGDTSFDFNKDLPDGVTVDAGAVDVSKTGAYEIVYSQNGATLKKTAYVFGTPEILFGGEKIGENYEVTYKDAVSKDFSDAETWGITAKDTFGTEIAVKAESDKYFAGDYGSYIYNYSATDLAGNTVSANVTFVVSGSKEVNISAEVPDVADESVTITMSLTEDDIKNLYLYANGEYVDYAYYYKSESGLTINTAAFRDDLERNKKDIELKITTKEWCEKYTLSFTDVKPLVYEEPIFDGRFYAQAEYIELPVPQKELPQQFEFEYSAEGASECNVDVTADGTSIIISNRAGGMLALGDYTVKISGVRNSVTEREDEAIISVLTAEDYAVRYVKNVAPLDNASDSNGLAPKDASYISFDYDSEMDAYKVTPLKTDNTHMNSIMAESDSETLTKLQQGCDMFTYLAFDMYFSAPGSQNGITFWVATESGAVGYQGYWFSEITYTQTEDNLKLGSYLSVKANTWYTIYIQTGGLTKEVNGGYDLFDQAICDGASENSVYWVKNIRFEDEIPEYKEKTYVSDKYIYTVSDKQYSLPASFGAESILNGPSGEIVLGADNTFKMTEAGLYTATENGKTITFTAYTAEEYEKIVAPLVSDQHDYALTTGNAEYSTFEYDASMNAYKMTPLKNNNTGANCLIVNTDNEVYDKITAGCDKYTYLAFDMCFEESPYGMFWWLYTEDNSMTPYHGYWYGELTYVDAESKSIINSSENKEKYELVEGGKWYTVYIQTGGLSTQYTYTSYNLITQQPSEGDNSAYWIRNIRFTDTIDAVN